MNDITFNRGRGGLGRALAGKDHFCGIVAEMQNANIPTALKNADLFAKIYSLQEAEDLGIVYDESQNNAQLDDLRYQIENVFEYNDKAVIFLAIADTTANRTVSNEVVTMQNKSGGEVRQALLMATLKDFDVADLSSIQNSCDILEAEHKPLSVIYSANFIGGTFPDLSGLAFKNISVVAGMDGNGVGAGLTAVYNKSILCGGAVLGCVSRAKVNESIAWVEKFNLNDNSRNEFDVLKIGDGRLLVEVSTSELNNLDLSRYIFPIKHIGKAGSYFNDTHTAISISDDLSYIERNRVIDKAIRNCREFLLPSLNAPLFVNDDGTLTEDTIADFKNEAERSLEDMQKNGEVSAFEVVINPAQNVVTSSKLAISIKIVPVGVARNIEVNIGFSVNVN